MRLLSSPTTDLIQLDFRGLLRVLLTCRRVFVVIIRQRGLVCGDAVFFDSGSHTCTFSVENLGTRPGLNCIFNGRNLYIGGGYVQIYLMESIIIIQLFIHFNLSNAFQYL